jgi:hypothetical protein
VVRYSSILHRPDPPKPEFITTMFQFKFLESVFQNRPPVTVRPASILHPGVQSREAIPPKQNYNNLQRTLQCSNHIIRVHHNNQRLSRSYGVISVLNPNLHNPGSCVPIQLNPSPVRPVPGSQTSRQIQFHQNNKVFIRNTNINSYICS